MKMSDRRPAQNIGELDIHLSNLQTRVAEVAQQMQGMANNMATRQDIDGIKLSMAALATKAEVAAEIASIREEVNRNKPATIWKQFVSVCLGLAVVVSAAGLVVAAVRAFDRIPPAVIAGK